MMMAKMGDRVVSSFEYRKDAVKKWNQSTLARCSSERDGWGQIKMDPYPYFIVCVQCSDLEEVERILKSGFDVNTQSEDGITGLHEACFHDDLDMAQVLLDHGAKINLTDNSGFTPLHSAATSASLEMLELLIENGADPLIRNYKGLLPVEMCEESDGELAEYLNKIMKEKEKNSKDDSDEEQSHFLKDVQKWIKNNEVNKIRGPNGDTPLHLAASKGYIESAELLIKAKINLEAKDNDGWTPLHCAVYWGELEIVKLLVLAGADIYALETYGHTAYDFVDLIIKRIDAGQFFYPEDMKIQTEIKKYFDAKIRSKIVDLSKLGSEFIPDDLPPKSCKSILSIGGASTSSSTSSTISRPPTVSRPGTTSTQKISTPPSSAATSTSTSSSSSSASGIKLPPTSRTTSSATSATSTTSITKSSTSLPPSSTTASTNKISDSSSSVPVKPISRPPIASSVRSTIQTADSSSTSFIKLPPSSTSPSTSSRTPVSTPPTTRVTASSSSIPSSPIISESLTTASISEVMSLRKEIEALREKLAVKDRVIERYKKELEKLRGY